MSILGVFSGLHLHSGPFFSLDACKYGPEKPSIRPTLTQWFSPNKIMCSWVFHATVLAVFWKANKLGENFENFESLTIYWIKRRNTSINFMRIEWIMFIDGKGSMQLSKW